VNKARADLMSKVHKNQYKTSRTAAYNLPSFRPLSDEDKRMIYAEYEQAWNAIHHKTQTFKELLDEYIVEHNRNEDFLTFDDF